MSQLSLDAASADNPRLRIIEAAGEIFAAKGFQATTVRDICHLAGANIAAVSYYFGDKQRLFIATVLAAHQWHVQRFSLPAWPNDTPPEEKLAGFIYTFLLRIRSGPGDTWHARLLMRELTQPSPACAAVAQDSIRPQFEILLSILRELLPDVDEEKLHLTAFSVVGQCLFYHVGDPVVRTLVDPLEYAGYENQKLARHITELVLKAIAAPSAEFPRPRKKTRQPSPRAGRAPLRKAPPR